MAQAPYTPYPTESPSAPGGRQLDIPSDPSDFGGLIGQGEHQLAAGLNNAGTDLFGAGQLIQERHNLVAVDAAFNQLQQKNMDRLYGTQDNPGGFYGLRGANAMAAQGPTVNGMEADRVAIKNSLQNEAQQLRFEQDSRRMNLYQQEAIGRHAATQSTLWDVQTQQAGEALNLRAIGLNPADETEFQHRLSDGMFNARKKAAAAGGGPDIIENAAQQFSENAYAARVQGMAATDPSGALAYLKANQKSFNPAHYDTIQSGLETKARSVDSDRLADDAYNGRTPAVPSGGGRPSVTIPKGTFSDPAKEQTLNQIIGRESGGQNVLNYRNKEDPAYYTAGGYYQIVNSTWREGAGMAGVDTGKYPTAISAPFDVQTKVAGALYDKYGTKPWAATEPSGPRLATVRGQPVAAPPTTASDMTSGAVTGEAPAQGGGEGVPGGTAGITFGATPTGTTTPDGTPVVPAGWDRAAALGATYSDKNDAYQRVIGSGADDATQRMAITKLNQKYGIEKAARKEAEEKAFDEYVPKILTDPLHVDVNKIASDTRLNGHQQWQLNEMLHVATNNEPKAAAVSHATASSLIGDMRRPSGDPQRITDLSPLYTAYQNGKLNNADFNFVQNQFKEMQTPDGDRLNTMIDNFLRAVKPSIEKSNPLMGTLDMTGGTLFFQLQRDLADKVGQYRKDGKNPYDLLDPAKPDYIGKPESLSQYQKSIPESMTEIADRLRKQAAVTAKPATLPVARTESGRAAPFLGSDDWITDPYSGTLVPRSGVAPPSARPPLAEILR